ncbi:MAG: hypothetical protein ACYDAQ_15050, partial [Mycobacteriales bacterium]
MGLVWLAGAAGGAGKDWEQSACGALPFRSACGALEAADAGRPVRPAGSPCAARGVVCPAYTYSQRFS